MQKGPRDIQSALKEIVERFVRGSLSESVIEVKIGDTRLTVVDKTPIYEIEGSAVLRWVQGKEQAKPFKLRLELETGKISSYEFGEES